MIKSMIRVSKPLFIAVSLILLTVQAFAQTSDTIITGKTINVADGDTITILDAGKTQHKIRLYGIDAPEKKQAFGEKSRRYLADQVAGKQVTVKVLDRDRYGRIVGLVFAGAAGVPDQSTNAALIINGLAWHYGQYCKADFCGVWKRYEAEAKSKKLGLWADKNPVPPWDYRRGVTGKTESKRETVKEAYRGNTNSLVFHGKGCRHYNCGNCTAVFSDREEAVRAGYRPCGICKP